MFGRRLGTDPRKRLEKKRVWHCKYRFYMQMLVAVANGIRADFQNFGPDSPLYRSLGFVPSSERKRPRLRRSGAVPGVEDDKTPSTGSADAA